MTLPDVIHVSSMLRSRAAKPPSLTVFALALMLVLAALVPAARAADPVPTLRVAFPVAETGFDPAAVADLYSANVVRAIFDTLYTYDYFASPPKLMPSLAAAMPEVAEDGRTYTIRIRPGTHFAPDPAFDGRRRELTAADFVYAWKRVLDPKIRSYYYVQALEGRLEGGDAAVANARATGRFDYDAPIAGLQATDRYTLRVRFIQPFYSFPHWLGFYALAPVAREVVERYRDAANRVMENPVGTGPYRLAEWRRSQKIVLLPNPEYRDVRFPAPPDPADAAAYADLVGRRLPLAPRVEISIIEEGQPRLLAFEKGELDVLEVPSSLAPNVLDGDRLKAPFAQRGIRLHRQVEPSLSFTFFNLDDPVVGGYAPAEIALRRAILMGYDRAAQIRTLNNGQAALATQMVPPGVESYDPKFDVGPRYDPVAARALLDRFGYRDRDGDGYRERPDGTPLAIEKASTPNAADRALDELWKKNMDALGIRMTFMQQKWPDLVKMGEAGKLQMWNLGWIAALPDADQFYSLLSSKNIGTANDARLRLPEYDRLYEVSRRLPDGAERDAAYRKMNELMAAYGPWLLGTYTTANWLVQPKVRGFRLHPFLRAPWWYYGVAPAR
jgi:oligopeptide transport system substrate-binding protein